MFDIHQEKSELDLPVAPKDKQSSNQQESIQDYHFVDDLPHQEQEELVMQDPNMIDEQVAKDVLKDVEPFFIKEMRERIEAVEEYSWNRGELGGLDWGYECMNKAFEGLNTGVILVAGQSNIGKSSFMLQLAHKIANANKIVTEQRNRKAFVLYFSLDDSEKELIPRLVAIDQRIPINIARFPNKYKDNAFYMEKRAVGVENTMNLAEYINLMDVNAGSDVEFIEEQIVRYIQALNAYDETYQLVVMVDNFHDITIGNPKMQRAQGNEKYDYLADKLTRMSTIHDVPIICSAEFRKLNGNRRPGVDDIRETVKIVYEAKAIMLCYNEVSIRGQQANVHWMKEGDPNKQAVYEVEVGKNKFSSFKNRLFFDFIPEMASFREVPEAGVQRYMQMVAG